MEPHTPFRSLSRRFVGPASSLSRTPSRRQQFTNDEINPLLSNLSPTSTLEALAATDAVPAGKRHRQSFIQNSVASASTSERAWGIKAAFAGKKLREWHEELLGWQWHGYGSIGSEEEDEHWVGLPSRIIEEYEERIEMIRDDMETLEVEDLKSYVRNTHLGPPSSRPSISAPATDYDHLDDFTAVILATIVQSLPILSRLNAILSLWTTRLVVVRYVPAFLRDSADCRESMLSAWIAVGRPDLSAKKPKTTFSRKAFKDIQAVLQDQISQLGRRLDTMLDLLEGSKDTLPEQWIDTMDNLENEYSLWTVQAEELLLHNDIDVWHTDNTAIQSQEECELDTTAPLSEEQNRETLDVAIESGDRQRNAGVHSSPPRTPPTTLSASPKCSGQRSIDNHLDRLGMNTDGPSNFYLFDLHDRFQSEEKQQDSQALDGPKTRPIRSNTTRKPVPLVLDNRNSLADSTTSSDMGTDISYPGSATSDYFSNQSSPEIRSASVVEYIGSPALVTNPWSSKEAAFPKEAPSRRSSLQTERGGPATAHFGAPLGIISPISQRSRASTFVPEPAVPEEFRSSESGRLNPVLSKHVRTRSASMQSFEIIPKHEIHQITVRRSESYSSAPLKLRDLTKEMEKEPNVPAIAKLESRNADSLRNAISAEKAGNQQEEAQVLPLPHYDQNPDALKMRPQGGEEPPLPPRSPHRFEQVSYLGPGSSPVKIRRKAAIQSSSKDLHLNPDDRLEARISSILTEIPTHIRLTSAPERVIPDTNGVSSRPKTPTSRQSALRLNRAQTAVTPPTLTLAPAQPSSFKSRPQNGEPDIKLYHLHQSGTDAPIKLFVRLVGEAGERVMVRIGGGWADLAEYLKEYASHHGRRSVSDMPFQIQGLSSSPTIQGSSSRPASPISSKPSPAMMFKRQHTTPGSFESPRTPISDPSGRPVSRMSWTDEDSPSLGLAGPKVRKVEISPRKQAWVEEMLEQARGGAGGGGIGDMGKVGKTKRVFFKGRSRAPSNV